MKAKVGLVHTVDVLIDPLEKLFSELSDFNENELKLVNFVDESLLNEVREQGRITPSATRRACNLMMSAQDSGVDLILFTCSSLSPTVDTARQMARVKILKIDDPMTEKAVSLGRKIGVLATVNSTIEPTSDLLIQKANRANKKIDVSTQVSEKAFEVLLKGERSKHDEIIINDIKNMAKTVDVIVLAQASMARLSSKIEGRVDIPVLTSPELAVRQVIPMLKN